MTLVARTWWVVGLIAALGCGDDESPGGGHEGGAGGASAAGGAASGGASQGGSAAGGENVGGFGGAGAGGSEGGAGGGAPTEWTVPTCTTVEGPGAVTFTHDEGASLAATGALTPVTYTFGLVALGEPDTLLASSAGALLRSEDAGCTWAEIAELPHPLLRLERGPDDVVYGWFDNEDVVARIDAGVVTTLDPPGIGLHGLGVDAVDPMRVRVLDDVGQLHESLDGGQSWTAIGVPVGDSALLYVAAFDPSDLDHALVGVSSDAAFVTFDGGVTWDEVTGVGAIGNANGFSIVVSPSDPTLVWLQGMDLGTAIGEEVRRIWRSEDGGVSFEPVVEGDNTIILTNGVLLAPHPTETDVVYFVFGTYYQGYGTDLYKYDHTTGEVTLTHNGRDDISSIAFHPTSPTTMYLGLTEEM